MSDPNKVNDGVVTQYTPEEARSIQDAAASVSLATVGGAETSGDMRYQLWLARAAVNIGGAGLHTWLASTVVPDGYSPSVQPQQAVPDQLPPTIPQL